MIQIWFKTKKCVCLLLLSSTISQLAKMKIFKYKILNKNPIGLTETEELDNFKIS